MPSMKAMHAQHHHRIRRPTFYTVALAAVFRNKYRRIQNPEYRMTIMMIIHLPSFFGVVILSRLNITA
jgi:hypothetical protein